MKVNFSNFIMSNREPDQKNLNASGDNMNPDEIVGGSPKYPMKSLETEETCDNGQTFEPCKTTRKE